MEFEMSRKAWVLDTETKGTGAHVEPLKDAKPRQPEKALNLTQFKAPPRPLTPPKRREPRRFKVVDVLGNRVLADGVGAGDAIAALEQLRSVHDARVFVWDASVERWRMLTLSETRALWGFRAPAASEAGEG
jgi:hypothetical protein